MDNATIILLFVVVVVVIVAFGYWASSSNIKPTSQVSTNNGVNKAIALLNLTGLESEYDIPIGVSLQYISNLNAFQIPIIDAESNLEYTLQLLQQYYVQGYRVFIGFSISTTLQYCLQWFLDHQDTLGISLTSTAISLDVNKNVIRLSPSDVFTAFFMSSFINDYSYTNVLFIQEYGDLASSDIYNAIIPQLNNGITSTQVVVSNLTTDQQAIDTVEASLKSLPPNSIVVPLLPDYKQQYLQIVVDTLQPSQIPPQLDTSGIPPVFTSQQSQAFDGKYFFLILSNIYSLSNQELVQVLGPNFAENAYDAFNICRAATQTPDIKQIYVKVDHMLANVGTLELNNYNDKKYSLFSFIQWIGGVWTPYIICGNVNDFGIFVAKVFVTQNQV
jgi:hypothetical protein